MEIELKHNEAGRRKNTHSETNSKRIGGVNNWFRGAKGLKSCRLPSVGGIRREPVCKNKRSQTKIRRDIEWLD